MLRLTMAPFCNHKVLHYEHTHHLDINEIVDRLQIMRQIEIKNYQCEDYLELTRSLKKELNEAEDSLVDLDEFCREQICEWTYRVVDYFEINREIVAISLSYLDRFLSYYSCDRRTFKLAATASLFLAVKLHEPRKTDLMGILSDLSRGEFSMEDVIRMEREFLDALTWKLNPPTPGVFVGHFLHLLSVPVDSEVTRSISALAAFFTELAVCDYSFVNVNSSIIAVASILNAMETIKSKEFTRKSKNAFAELIAKRFGMLQNSNHLLRIRKKLWTLYERSEEFKLQDEQAFSASTDMTMRIPHKNDPVQQSPVCVSRLKNYDA